MKVNESYQREVENNIEDISLDSDALFNIASWGADLSFRELITLYDEDELIKPELQRKYVWDKVEASRFIESLLLGLPVPSIFLAKYNDRKLIVDGYQRIMTVYDYIKGIFSADNKVFKLSNSNKINKRWRNKAFAELTIEEQRKIKSYTIHAIIFEQRHPSNDDSSMYQIFERINSSGRALTPQEIRNCVYQGSFNSLLFRLNNNLYWRKLFGYQEPDSRMRDLELILRFFALSDLDIYKNSYTQISLKKTLNEFMSKHRDELNTQYYSDKFLKCIQIVFNNIGINAFHSYSSSKYTKKFHPAIYDAIMLSVFLLFSRGYNFKKVSDLKHIQLLTDEQFKLLISERTTNIDNIIARAKLASHILFGEELDEL